MAGVRTSGAGLGYAVREVGAELVLLDVRMPHGGVRAARELRTAVEQGRLDPVRVVALSADTSTSTVAAALRQLVDGG